MAYAAMVSLKHTIHRLLTTWQISNPSLELLFQDLYNRTSLEQDFLQKSNRLRLDSVEGHIREAAYELEDALDIYESDMLSSEVESSNDEDDGDNGEHLKVVIYKMCAFLGRVGECRQELLINPVPDEDGTGADAGAGAGADADADADADDGDGDGDEVEMVGHSSELTTIRDRLVERMRPDELCFFTIIGEAGSGRTVSARAFFQDQKQSFDCCAWLTMTGTQFSIKEIVAQILHQVRPASQECASSDNDDCKPLPLEEEEEEEDVELLCKYLYKALEHRRYLIVLDDIRDVQVLERLRSSFPDQSNGSLVLLTTNQKKMIGSLQPSHTMIMVDGELHSWGWFYLSSAIVNGERISAEIEQAGKEINANCGGRCLALAKTLLFLYKMEKTEEKWREIAADKEHPIFKVEDEIAEMHRIKIEMQSHNWNMDDERESLIVRLITSWINFSPQVARIKSIIHPRRFFPKMEIASLSGMAGIGKTTYAKKIIQDEKIMCNYDHCVWVTLGPKYQAEEILIDILAQIYPNEGKMRMKEDDNLVKKLCVELSGMRCFIVLDDVWSKEPLEHLKSLFPDIKGRAFVTTRLLDVVVLGEDDIWFTVRFLDEEESWTLLRHRVFPEGLCPVELEKAGRKIAENCDGLPLLLHKVAHQLLKVEKDQDYWKHVASGKESSVFTNAHDEISKALLPSYNILPQHVKPCFLYMGIYRKRFDISVSKLNDILTAEGFLEATVEGCLSLLEVKSLVMVQYSSGMKSCRLHSVFWHLCNTIAMNNRFFHAMNGYNDCSNWSMTRQRRLCIRASTLLGIRDVQESMAKVAGAHSLLCVGPPHQYPVPISFGMRLLRVMDALAIRQYEFPDEAVKLLHLRYLALTYWGELPVSISQLWKLQFLIVSRYVNTKSSKSSSLLPMEIWDMKELKHLQIMGGSLPNPGGRPALPKLTTLLDVSAQSCTREVLGKVPNLKRLGIRIELAPNDEGNSFDCLNNISGICGLESLKCVVVNPQFRGNVVEAPPPPPISMFPPSIIRLSLSGLGYPWEYMSLIGRLENLEVLKLKSYAFRGPMWVMNDMFAFKNLKFLVIEDADLVHWQLRVPSLTQFKSISIRHCYKLRELPVILFGMEDVEIVDCSPLTVTWAEQMRLKIGSFRLKIQRTWIDPRVHFAGNIEWN